MAGERGAGTVVSGRLEAARPAGRMPVLRMRRCACDTAPVKAAASVAVCAAILLVGCDLTFPARPPGKRPFPAYAAAADLPAPCFETNLGAWIPYRGPGFTGLWTLPHTVRLTRQTTRIMIPQFFVVEPVVFDDTTGRKHGSWRLQGRQLHVQWTDGFVGVDARLTSSRKGFVGEAKMLFDHADGDEPHAPLTMTAVPCPGS